MRHSHSLRTKKSKYVLLFACLMTVAALLGVYYFLNRDSGNSTNSIRDTNSVDYSGPTEEEIVAGDKQKQNNIERNEIENNPPQVSTAHVEISDATQYDNVVEVRAFISNVYEDGECVATFTKDGQPSVSTKSTAFRDASTTQCGAIDTFRQKFSTSGQWLVSVEYTSDSGIVGLASQNIIIN